MKTLRLAAAAALLALTCGVAAAQTTLRIGLAEDPDVLDPSLARTYVGRIVFASFCDKLFDIDRRLERRAAARAVARNVRRRQDRHDQAAAGRQVSGRRTVQRRSRQVLARPASHHGRLVPQAGIGDGRSYRRGRSAHDQYRAEVAIFSSDRSTDRSRRHDGVAEGGQGRRRQVRPASGLRRSL